ncbi:MAG TPA: hypoxanthine phosphoribosyltransferase [Ktedonobacterales bacterium]|nr:hypoxanthine phosphoribosyltransferase [Ktedonobacterales bacterium]
MSISSSMHEDIEEILISEPVLQARIGALASAIQDDYAGRQVLLVGILRGAMMFMADLARHLDMPLEMDFMAISSYGSATESSGVVRILKDLDTSIEGRHLLIVEDIIDSGLTLKYLTENLARRNPASIAICALLDKVKAHGDDIIHPQYTGFNIPSRFVVGYGLDYAQKYRNLPYIGVLKPSVYSE